MRCISSSELQAVRGRFHETFGKVSDRALFRNFVRNWHPSFTNGTQIFEIQFRFAVRLTTTAGGSLTQVVPFQLTAVEESLAIADLFDEFRITHGECTYVPHCRNAYDSSLAGEVPQAIAAFIDYDSSGTNLDLNEAWSTDTGKCFCTNETTHWDVHPMGQPDLAWKNTTADQSVASAYWKPYGNNLSISSEYGVLFCKMNVQFRAVHDAGG